MHSKSSIDNWTPEDELNELYRLIVGFFPLSIQSAVTWAIDLFEMKFNQEVQDLLTANPPDKLDDDGLPFWGG